MISANQDNLLERNTGNGEANDVDHGGIIETSVAGVPGSIYVEGEELKPSPCEWGRNNWNTSSNWNKWQVSVTRTPEVTSPTLMEDAEKSTEQHEPHHAHVQNTASASGTRDYSRYGPAAALVNNRKHERNPVHENHRVQRRREETVNNQVRTRNEFGNLMERCGMSIDLHTKFPHNLFKFGILNRRVRCHFDYTKRGKDGKMYKRSEQAMCSTF